jgi:aminoglycoside phosphotransferase (APT) family kinase protein
MEFLSGELLKKEALTEKLCRQTGSLLACIHRDQVEGYGDLTAPDQLTSDPRKPFLQKFEEGLEECENHLPSLLIEKCREYYQKHAEILLLTDGPCVVHRDFRPGNLIVSDGDVQGVSDWSSARGGFAEEDFLEFAEWSNHPSYKEAFLEGYASIRKVPEYDPMMPLLRLGRAIGAIGFTVKRGTWEGKGAKIYQFNRQHLEAFLKE